MTEQKLRKCGECRERAVAPAVVDYPVEAGDLWDTYTVPDLPVFKCGRCGEYTLGVEALEILSREQRAAIRRWCQEHKPGPDYFESIGWGRTTMGEWWQRHVAINGDTTAQREE